MIKPINKHWRNPEFDAPPKKPSMLRWHLTSWAIGLAFLAGYLLALHIVQERELEIPQPPPVEELKGATPDIQEAYAKGVKKINLIDWTCR